MRDALMRHVPEPSAEFSLTCEMSLLFRMLATAASGTVCQVGKHELVAHWADVWVCGRGSRHRHLSIASWQPVTLRLPGAQARSVGQVRRTSFALPARCGRTREQFA